MLGQSNIPEMEKFGQPCWREKRRALGSVGTWLFRSLWHAGCPGPSPFSHILCGIGRLPDCMRSCFRLRLLLVEKPRALEFEEEMVKG